MDKSFSEADQLHRYLETLADQKYATFSGKLIPNLRYPMIGVRIPALRKLAKEMARTDAVHAMDVLLTELSFEELLLKGFVLGYAHLAWTEWAKRVAAYVPLMNNWAVCDMVCASLTFIRKHRTEGWELLRPYTLSEGEFEQRFAMILLMDHYLTDDWIDHTLDVIKKLQPAGYYAAMAAGWALQRAFVKWPEKVFDLLTDSSIRSDIRLMARKKLLESRCTLPQWRERIKALHPA